MKQQLIKTNTCIQTSVKIKDAGFDPHIVIVTCKDNVGTLYVYGVFSTRSDAAIFATDECKGFDLEITRLAVIER